MAEEEQAEVDNSAQTAAAARKKKQLKLLGALVAALLLVCGAGTWAALHFLGGSKAAPDAQAGAEQPKEPTRARAEYLALDPTFLANFSVDGRQHYLQVALAVMTRDPAVLEGLRRHMPLIRNELVMLLNGEVFEQLQTDAGRVALQQKLLTAIRAILKKETGKDDVEQVLFTNFVMT